MTATESDFDEPRVLAELEALHATIRGLQGAPVVSPQTAVALEREQIAEVPRRRPAAPLVWGGGMLAAAALAAVVFWPRAPRLESRPPVEQSPAAVAQAPAPPPPSVDPHAVRADLTLGRRVWIRVTVDGSVVLERETTPGEQLHFGADRSIVVRTGDAGGVAVRLNGVDQGPMGRDGQVLTRLFEAPARQ
jgi:hypothetical protein